MKNKFFNIIFLILIILSVFLLISCQKDNKNDKEPENIVNPEPNPDPIPEPEPEPIIDPEPEPEPIVDPEPEPEPIVDPEPEPEPEPIIDPEPEPEPIVDPEPEPVERVIIILASNFQNVDFLDYTNVVPNTSYPNEFTINKSTGAISSSKISKITKIILTIYSTNDNMKVYDRLDDGHLITPTKSSNPNYNNSTSYTYIFDEADEFLITNPSSKNTYVFELAIFYKGKINSEHPIAEENGKIVINSDTYQYHSKLSSSIEAKNNNLLFKEGSFIKVENLGVAKSVELPISDLVIYGIDEAGNQTLLRGTIVNDNYFYDIKDEYDSLLIINELQDDIEINSIIILYTEKKAIIDGDTITIEQALEIASGLSRSRGTTEEYYYISGTILSVDGATAILTDGEKQIKCYQTTQPDNMLEGYYVTLNGQIQNYYSTPEIVNYTVVEYKPALYNITVLATTNGTFEVSKTENLSYGEKITVTATPNEGYYAKYVSVSGRPIKFKDNIATIAIYGNCEIKAVFALIEEEHELAGDTFVIHSLEMSGTYGDANLIQYGDYDILIDGGTTYDGANLAQMLETYVTDQVLELVIISHPDSDHYQGITQGGALYGVADVLRIITNDENGTNTTIENYVKSLFPNVQCDRASLLTSEAEKFYTIEVDSFFQVNILYNSMYNGSNNNASIPVLITYKNTKLFMGGDMEQASCNAFITTYPDLFDDDDFVIFKILHHGSKGSNKDNFLQYLKPDMCFVNAPLKTTGNQSTPQFNTHPYLDAMVIVGAYTDRCYWAGISGNLIIECDGYEAVVVGEGRSRDYYYQDSTTGQYIKASRDDETEVTFFESGWYKEAILNHSAPDYSSVLEY